eukprot:3533834-Amphidinium_carterae.1
MSMCRNKCENARPKALPSIGPSFSRVVYWLGTLSRHAGLPTQRSCRIGFAGLPATWTSASTFGSCPGFKKQQCWTLKHHLLTECLHYAQGYAHLDSIQACAN